MKISAQAALAQQTAGEAQGAVGQRGRIPMNAQELFARGYFPISNRHRLASRIDRKDWVEHMAITYRRAAADFYDFNSDGTLSDNIGHWREHYVRCLSKDSIEDIEPQTYAELRKLWRDVYPTYKELP